MAESQNNKGKDRRIYSWVIGLVIFIIVIVVLFIFMSTYISNVIRDIAADALSPVAKVNSEIQTEVADILHPTPTIIPDPITIIRNVRSLSRLETIQYSVEKVITAEIGQGQFGFLFGDRLLFVAHGIVIAGVDLEKLETEDLWFENNILYISLPEPEIFIATLDNDKSYVYDREKGLLTSGDQNLETNARQVAEMEIEKAAIEDGILERAKDNAELFLERFLMNLGYDGVIFVTPLPES
ncbi:MAG: DUF4230 domain-containing protein [Anaerolineaceae bacterium]|nr:DUF4230 domain-containing protein [Anaerolineaceae bacterium]